jgi:hypothetical protein
MKKLMAKFGWVPVSELRATQAKSDLDSERMYQWSQDLIREYEDQYRELAERWAETREHLVERTQRHALEKAMLNYANLMPQPPFVIEKKHQ